MYVKTKWIPYATPECTENGALPIFQLIHVKLLKFKNLKNFTRSASRQTIRFSAIKSWWSSSQMTITEINTFRRDQRRRKHVMAGLIFYQCMETYMPYIQVVALCDPTHIYTDTGACALPQRQFSRPIEKLSNLNKFNWVIICIRVLKTH